jgi:hypothetical protein
VRRRGYQCEFFAQQGTRRCPLDSSLSRREVGLFCIVTSRMAVKTWCPSPFASPDCLEIDMQLGYAQVRPFASKQARQHEAHAEKGVIIRSTHVGISRHGPVIPPIEESESACREETVAHSSRRWCICMFIFSKREAQLQFCPGGFKFAHLSSVHMMQTYIHACFCQAI